MKIFISSTVYDLIDARSEIFNYLADLGYDVLLSDINQSGFEIATDKSSIEICLDNVRKCDFFILIIDRRYGPTLEKYGYDKISATHLEYEEALKHEKPIHVYVRDRTFAEFSIYKKSKEDFVGYWVDEKNKGLFELILIHSHLDQKNKNNWINTFGNSFELRLSIHKNLNIPFWKENLAKKISQGLIPLLTAQQETELVYLQGQPMLQTRVTIKNNSKSTAFIQKLAWADDKREPKKDSTTILLPGEDVFMVKIRSVKANQQAGYELQIQYSSYEGIIVTESYRAHASATTVAGQVAIIQGIESMGRKFKIGTPIEFNVEE